MGILQEYWFILIAIIVLLIAFIVVLLIYIQRMAERQKEEKITEESSQMLGASRYPGMHTASDANEAQNLEPGSFAESKRKTQFAQYSMHESTGTRVLFDGPQTLWVTDMNRPEKSFKVAIQGSVMIGAAEDCQVCLDYDNTVSSHHCCIYENGGRIYLENFSTMNPVIVNGQRAVDEVLLYSGTEIVVGNVHLIVKFS